MSNRVKTVTSRNQRTATLTAGSPQSADINECYLRRRPAKLLELRWRCKGLEFRSKRERHREAAWEGRRPQPNADVSKTIKCCR
jgi:hypothetical protein